LVTLDPVRGAEIRKTRPAVIVNDDSVGILPLKVIVPITEWKDRYSAAPWMVALEPDKRNGLAKRSAADAFQVRSVAQERMVQKVGALSGRAMKALNRALAAVLGIEPEDLV